MTTPACPLSDYLKRTIRDVIDQVDGVERVHIDVVWNPPWSPEMMDPDVRRQGVRRPPQYAWGVGKRVIRDAGSAPVSQWAPHFPPDLLVTPLLPLVEGSSPRS